MEASLLLKSVLDLDPVEVDLTWATQELRGPVYRDATDLVPSQMASLEKTLSTGPLRSRK